MSISQALQFHKTLSSLSPLELTNTTRSLLASAEKAVSIEIASGDLQFLKENKYKLCFAKRVSQSAYNIVWQSYSDYLSFNDFSWTPQYQMFGSNSFQAQVQVKVSTNLVTIGLGESAELQPSGLLGAPSTGGPETGVTMINAFGPIHPGLSQMSTGLNGQQSSTPFYVAENQIALGNVTMTPVEQVLVWFEQDVATGTMFSSARSLSTEIDMTFTNSSTRKYENGRWTTP